MAIGKFLIEASHIMMFARSVGDPNPIYFDEDFAKNTNCGGHHTSPYLCSSKRSI